MKIIKFFVALSVVTMLGLGVSSCGGGDDNPAGSSGSRAVAAKVVVAVKAVRP